MPANPPELTPGLLLLGFFALAVMAGIVGAWSYAIVRWSLGQRLLPVAKPRAVPWGFLAVLAIVALRFAVQLPFEGLFLALKPGALAAIRAGKSAFSPFEQMFLVGLVNLGVIALTYPVLRLISGARLDDVGLPGRPIGLNLIRGIWLCFASLPVVYGLMLLVTLIWKPTQHPAALSLFENPSAASIAMTLISAVLLAPAAEELMFRVVLLGWLTRLGEGLPRPGRRRADDPLAGPRLDADSEMTLADPALIGSPASPLVDREWLDPETVVIEPGPPIGPEARPAWDSPARPIVIEEPAPAPSRLRLALPNVVTSLLFAVVHAPQWPAPVPLFILALGLGLIYRRTGSFWAPFALHATFNGLSMTAALLALLAGIKPGDLPKPAIVDGTNLECIEYNATTFVLQKIALGEDVAGGYDSLPRSTGCDLRRPRDGRARPPVGRISSATSGQPGGESPPISGGHDTT